MGAIGTQQGLKLQIRVFVLSVRTALHHSSKLVILQDWPTRGVAIKLNMQKSIDVWAVRVGQTLLTGLHTLLPYLQAWYLWYVQNVIWG